MALTGKQKKYLRKYVRKKTLGEITSDLGIEREEIEKYLQRLWGKEKFGKLILEEKKKKQTETRQEKVKNFVFKNWLIRNERILFLLSLLVWATYINILPNQFLSDDIAIIVENKELENLSHAFAQPTIILRPLFYVLIVKNFGRIPLPFHLVNIFFHWGTVLVLYLLIDLLIDSRTALVASLLFAVHPLLSEAVTWISGGPYSQYTFFLLLAFIFYLFSQKKKKFLVAGMACFLAALLTHANALVFPIVLGLFILVFDNLRQNWKKLIPWAVLGGIWGVIYVGKIGERLTGLQTLHYQEAYTANPLLQVPVAITSYLQLLVWPRGLTLYHSELTFSRGEYFLRLTSFLVFLGVLAYTWKRQKQIFFWLSLFFISLLPTLTPFGISWIVAERYVYLGAVGLIVVAALGIKKLMEVRKLKVVSRVFLGILVAALFVRTVVRNLDWRDQDHLWLAAAKTSPSSAQNHNNLGDYYARHGDLEMAAEEFKKAIELKANYGDAYHNLANTYHQMGEIELAIKNFEKALETNPNLWQSHQQLAVIYFEQGNFDLAREELETAIGINPQEIVLYYNLGIVWAKAGEKQKAKEAFLKVLEMDPDNLQIRKLLEEIEAGEN